MVTTPTSTPAPAADLAIQQAQPYRDGTRIEFTAGSPAIDPDPSVTVTPLGRLRAAASITLDLDDIERIHEWTGAVLAAAERAERAGGEAR